ncbi:hypothetical protein EOPP23_02700 [Endozoicomonas sp. OPT23]|uniref:FAD-dependent oxidoreductase n=1 Tax=Endozoicomonas sp. OPT23 TaxID=2072845 RepID=UPI00129BAB9F|nr:FAD-dependent oxidoreductase [Endozoicomonas sp. OPT23]MRI31906.1 hypothetical protein [Endozoicomonas sp. OPT23]
MNENKVSTLILVGGGHTHALLLNKIQQDSFPECRFILISGKRYTPYSGMLPGVIAGHYSVEQSHIDLKTLAEKSGCEFIEEQVSALDPDAQTVTTESGQVLEYDFLSINTGSTQSRIIDASNAISIKPVEQFLGWLESETRLSEQPFSLAIAGAGAAGVEVALALRERFKANQQLDIHLLVSGQQILSGYSSKVQNLMLEELERKNIQLHTGFEVAEAREEKILVSTRQQTLAYDQLILATPAIPVQWPANSGLAVNSRGFISLNQNLQSTSHNNVFACGDVADFQGPDSDTKGLAKCGVYAVRQAPTLYANLQASLTGEGLQVFQPQSKFLSLLSCADGRAIASRGWLKARGRLIWVWKDWLDRQFMARFPLPEKGTMKRL